MIKMKLEWFFFGVGGRSPRSRQRLRRRDGHWLKIFPWTD